MKNVFIKFGIALVLLAAAFIACEQEVFDKEDNSLTVDEAKSWFEANQPEFLVLKSGGMSKDTKVIKPEWKGAFASHNREVEVVETHIVANGAFGFATKDAYRSWEQTKFPGYITSLSRIVVMRYKDTGEIVSFIMTIVGDKEYLEKKDFKMWDNDYVVRDNDFSGLVLYHSLEGKFVNGWRYTNGEVTHKVKLDFDVDVRFRLKESYLDCTTTAVYLIEEQCTDHYTSGELPDGSFDWDNARFSYRSCETTSTYAGSIEQCVVVNTGDDNDDNSGGTSGGYEPNGDNTKLDKIKNIVNLPPELKLKLEKALKDMVKNNCLSKAVYNSLVDSDFKINFEIKDSGIGGAGYNPDTKTISFVNADAITVENLKEEMFHAWQDAYYSGGTSQYRTKGYVNIEFEAKLLEDINPNKISCCSAFRNPNVPNELKMEYFDMVSSIRSTGVINITNEKYLYWVTKFGQYNPLYNSIVDPDLSQPNAVKSILSSSNCY